MTTNRLAPTELTRLRNAFARLTLQWLAAPTRPGAYRLFAYVIARTGKAAYANIPFYVEDGGTTTAGR